jgi:RNase P subunit RPR2
MIEKVFVVTCDWCGKEYTYRISKRKEDVLNDFAKTFHLYKFVGVNPLADELFANTRKYIPKHLMFCCENCAGQYFRESPEELGHYKIVNK